MNAGLSAFDLVGSIAVVTGASRGIGEAIAVAFLRAGADVIALQRTPPSEALRAAARECHQNLEHVTVDFADEASVAAAIDETLRVADVDILVNNAGTQIRHDSLEFPLSDFDAVMSVNARSVFQLCTGFAAGMVSRRRGKIVNLASLLSFQGGFRVPAYAASKGAVAQLTKAFANEWAVHGVNVNAIVPGYLATEMNSALLDDEERSGQIMARIPAGRWGQPSDIAGAAVFLASPAADYVHGIALPVDGGWLGR